MYALPVEKNFFEQRLEKFCNDVSEYIENFTKNKTRRSLTALFELKMSAEELEIEIQANMSLLKQYPINEEKKKIIFNTLEAHLESIQTILTNTEKRLKTQVKEFIADVHNKFSYLKNMIEVLLKNNTIFLSRIGTLELNAKNIRNEVEAAWQYVNNSSISNKQFICENLQRYFLAATQILITIENKKQELSGQAPNKISTKGIYGDYLSSATKSSIIETKNENYNVLRKRAEEAEVERAKAVKSSSSNQAKADTSMHVENSLTRSSEVDRSRRQRKLWITPGKENQLPISEVFQQAPEASSLPKRTSTYNLSSKGQGSSTEVSVDQQNQIVTPSPAVSSQPHSSKRTHQSNKDTVPFLFLERVVDKKAQNNDNKASASVTASADQQRSSNFCM
jgi:hypothetical protein